MASMTGSKGEFLRALLSSQPYKPGQGTMARNGTIAAIAVLVVAGAYSWSQAAAAGDPVSKWVLPFVFGAVAMWIGYRLVHFPRFADFLISTEAEMNKVSWPSWREVRTSTVVVLVSTFFLAACLFVFDMIWRFLLICLGVLQMGFDKMLGPGGSGLFHVPPLPVLLDHLLKVWL